MYYVTTLQAKIHAMNTGTQCQGLPRSWTETNSVMEKNNSEEKKRKKTVYILYTNSVLVESLKNLVSMFHFFIQQILIEWFLCSGSVQSAENMVVKRDGFSALMEQSPVGRYTVNMLKPSDVRRLGPAVWLEAGLGDLAQGWACVTSTFLSHFLAPSSHQHTQNTSANIAVIFTNLGVTSQEQKQREYFTKFTQTLGPISPLF